LSSGVFVDPEGRGFCCWSNGAQWRDARVGRIDDAASVANFGAADGDDVGAVAIGFFLTNAGDSHKLRDSFGTGDDEIVEDAVREDHESRLACFGGFDFAPVT